MARSLGHQFYKRRYFRSDSLASAGYTESDEMIAKDISL